MSAKISCNRVAHFARVKSLAGFHKLFRPSFSDEAEQIFSCDVNHLPNYEGFEGQVFKIRQAESLSNSSLQRYFCSPQRFHSDFSVLRRLACRCVISVASYRWLAVNLTLIG